MHTNQTRWLFCVFVVVLRLNSCGLQVSIFETRKTRLQSHTMGINPIDIKKSQNSIQIWTGFQQQITEYKKLMSCNKYLTTILASTLPIFVFKISNFLLILSPTCMQLWTLVFHSSSHPLSFWTSCIVAACYTFFVLPLCMCSTLSAT